MRICAPWLGRLSPALAALAHAATRRRVPRAAHALLAVCLLLLSASRPAAGAEPPLALGVFPNMTAKQILQNYRPLADALEQALGRRVVIYSARDFKTFVERTRRGDYDILLTAPHLAWLARQDAGYRPLLKYAQPVHGLLVVKSGSRFDTPDALRGRTVATPDSIAVVVLALQAELAERGLKAGIDYRTNDSTTHLNAVMQLVNGRADAAMAGLHPYLLMPPEVRGQLRVLAKTRPLSSLMYLTHPRLRDREAQLVRRALLDFAASSAGETFMLRGGYGGFKTVDGSELRAFRPYALQAQELLRNAR